MPFKFTIFLLLQLGSTPEGFAVLCYHLTMEEFRVLRGTCISSPVVAVRKAAESVADTLRDRHSEVTLLEAWRECRENPFSHNC